MAPRAPVSPGHFDRFNFCNAAHGWELQVTHAELNTGNGIPFPIHLGPQGVSTFDVCSPAVPPLNATSVTVRADATDINNPGNQKHYDHTYTAPAGYFLNNLVFGIIDRCAPAHSPEAVFFGEVEISDNVTPPIVVKWEMMPEEPH